MKTLMLSILVSFYILCDGQVEGPDKYVPRSARKRVQYATPESGTYLKPVAYSILKKMSQIIEKHDSINEPSEWMINMLNTHQKHMLDTTLNYMGNEVPVRIYFPTKKSLKGNQPVTLFFHGGGFILGSVEQYNIMVSKMARITGQIIISVEYRLAPKYPFPAAIMDCFAVLQLTQENGVDIGVDTSRICVMGDSAGGNIATVLTLLCRDQQRPQPLCQVLLYPGLTFVDTGFPSRIFFGTGSQTRFIPSESFLRKVKSMYMGVESNDRHPYISPLEAELSNDLAPALIITAECDPLRDGGRLYAKNLKNAGVEVKHLEYSGMIHAFMSFHMILSDALDAMKEIRDYLDTI